MLVLLDVNGRDSYGQTPLHCAILGQQLEATQFLLDHKGKVHVMDNKQDTPIHAAVRTGNVRLLKELLVDPRIDVNINGKEKVTALHIAVQMDHETTLEICQLLLLSGASVTAKDINNRTPLCLAVIKGARDVVEFLFHHAKVIKDCKMDELLYNVDQNGSTILHFAVDTGQLKMVEICISYGARVDKVKESDGTTAVHMACTYGSFEILKALLKSVSYVYSYSLSDKQGLTCLHKAAMYDHIDIVKFLKGQGIELNDLDNEQRTPLLLAASRGCTNAVEMLLEYGAESTIKDAKNRTVLHCAVGHSETLAALLKHVSIREMMNAVDEQGSTALHYAAQGGFLKNVCLLQQRWTRTSVTNKYTNRIRNHKGELPLHLAARYGWIDVTKKLLQTRDFRQIDMTNDHEKTPLHCAAEEGHGNLVSLLLENHASVTKDRDGKTALHMAAAKGSLKSVVNILRAKPRCINEVDKELNTGLHLAAQGGHAHIVCYLLSIKGQKVTLNAYNQNVLDVAVGNEHAEVAMAMAQHNRWSAVLRCTVRGAEGQMQLLVRRLPHVAERFLDNCVTSCGSPESIGYKVSYDFRLLQGMPEENNYSYCSLDALETMVKYKRLECLTHPLCQAFLNIKWRKVGLNEVIPQFILFFTYILSLGCLIIYQPCGRPKDYKWMNLTCVPGDILYYGTWPFYIRDDGLTGLRVMYWICLSICCLRVPKELSVMQQGVCRYLSDIENVFNLIAMTITFVFFLYVIPFGRPTNTSGKHGYLLTVVTVILSCVLFIKHLRNYKIFGLYITMVMKIIKTFIRVGFLLFMFIIAFAFSFYMINVDKNQIGLAVGDINRIQSSAELEVHARQVERLIQIERGFSKMLRKRSKVLEYTDYPNMKSSVRKKIVDVLVSLVTQARNREGKQDTTLKTRLDKHEERINEIYAQLRKQTQQSARALQTIKHIEEYLNRSASPSLDSTSISSLQTDHQTHI
ncbi:hypothetical protein QZH41_013507 [Actinostola sp. cb2023]|nr:hypothetical protein QZH41_013507 [Actinostola sp. cb2023]